MMINLNRLLVMASAVIFLAACGGGGGTADVASGDNKPNQPIAPAPAPAPTPELGMTVDASFVQVAELSERNVNLTFSGVQGDAVFTYTVVAADTIVNAVTISESTTNSGGILTIALGELNNEGRLSIDVLLADTEGRQVTGTIDVSATNTSGSAIVAQFAALHSNIESFIPLSDERNVFERFTHLLSMIDIEDSSVSTEFISFIDANIKTEVVSRAAEYDEQLESYNSGNIDESVLVNYMQDTQALLNTYVGPVNAAINSLSIASNGIVPSIPLKDVYVADGYNILSQFVGNTSLGQYDENGAWVFRDVYAFLTAIAIPGVETCNAE
jgi:hypothetical protein